jgi:dTDP-4-amino-4,6-dideoxygalactose transaminase
MPAWPWYAPDERAAVAAVLASGKVNYWTGTETRTFEQEYAAYLGVRHAIALANGTLALELPLRMWDIGPGDDVIVTPRSFIASVSCAVLLGARPVFADVDRDSGNITADSIEKVLTPNTRAIIPVHLAGWPCEMAPIMALAEARGIKVLEDCAQAHGARYRDTAVGSVGDAAAFSFCQDKIITTAGEGGLLASNDAVLWERAWSSRIMARPGMRSTNASMARDSAGCMIGLERIGGLPNRRALSAGCSWRSSTAGWSAAGRTQH